MTPGALVLAGWLLATGGYVVDGKLTCEAMGTCACAPPSCMPPARVTCDGVWRVERDGQAIRLRCAALSERET